jgi:hypothetical protein
MPEPPWYAEGGTAPQREAPQHPSLGGVILVFGHMVSQSHVSEGSFVGMGGLLRERVVPFPQKYLQVAALGLPGAHRRSDVKLIMPLASGWSEILCGDL